MIRVERHELGPRVFVLGRRVHEYQAGIPLLALTPAASLAGSILCSLGVALLGAWLVVKDWPDLFPATRDRASWRLGVHRLPKKPEAPPPPSLAAPAIRSSDVELSAGVVVEPA